MICSKCETEFNSKFCPNCGEIAETVKSQNQNLGSFDETITGNETIGRQNATPFFLLLTIAPLVMFIYIFFINNSKGFFKEEVIFNAIIYIIAWGIWAGIVNFIGKAFPGYREKVRKAKKIYEYFKTRFPILTHYKDNYRVIGTVSKESQVYDEAMFNVYMEAYKKDADAIIINSSNVSTQVNGEVTTTFSGVKGKTESTNTHHINATLIKY